MSFHINDDKARKSKWKWLIIVIAVLAFLLIVWKGWNTWSDSRQAADNADNANAVMIEQRTYPVDEAAAEAVKRLETEKNRAELKKAADVSQRKITIVFAGMAVPAQMEQIITILDEYNIKAVFCIDGMSAAEDIENVERIQKAGHIVGNYGFQKEPYLHECEETEIATSIAYTQAILEEITGEKADYFAGNAIRYNDKVLHAAYCADIKAAIEPSSFINESSFSTFKAAMGYVQSLSNGEIVCVKLNGALDELEYEEFEVDERPATDFEDDLQEEEEEEPQKDIVVTVQCLLEALDATQTAVVPLDRLYLDWDASLETMFATPEDAAQYQVPESESVGEDYFKDALFIGDSLTVTLSMREYPSGLDKTSQICAYKGITPGQILQNVTTENVDGEQVNVWDEITAQNPGKIYVLLGANGLSIDTNDTIIADYKRLVQALKEEFPSVPIFVMGLTPVTESTSAERATMTNRRIVTVNVLLAQMAMEESCYYIDLYTALADEEGNLPYSISQEDGIHLKENGVKQWIAYLASHVPAAE